MTFSLKRRIQAIARTCAGTRCALGALSGALFLLVSGASAARAMTTFATGKFLSPNSISQIPPEFGAYAGDYLIADYSRGLTNDAMHNIWRVPEKGGQATLFATKVATPIVSALFLPANWGKYAGKYAVFGFSGQGTPDAVGKMIVLEADGTSNKALQRKDILFTVAAVAPTYFSKNAGQVFVTAQSSNIYMVTSSGMAVRFATVPGANNAHGLAAAPKDFGPYGGKLFTTSGVKGEINVVDADGNAGYFASVPVKPGQQSAGEMAFVPDGWLPGYGKLLLVAVRSSLGGSSLGDIFALSAEGEIIASVRAKLPPGTKFDPNWIFVRPDGSLLVSDSGSQQIRLLTFDDFVVDKHGK